MKGWNFFDKLERRILVKGKLELLSGLHIGVGRGTEVTTSDNLVVRDIKDRPFIPGSSLKGILRSSLEGLFRGLIGKIKHFNLSCDIIADPCVKVDETVKEQWRRSRKDVTEGIMEEVEKGCEICKLFGSPWLASRVMFQDLPVDGKWYGYMETRDGVAIDRETETAMPQRKFDFEVVPSGTVFDLNVYLENPTDYQLGMLFLTFEQLNQGFTLLGGNKSRGLGRVRIDVEEIVEMTPEDIIKGTDRRISKTQKQEVKERVVKEGKKDIIEEGKGADLHPAFAALIESIKEAKIRGIRKDASGLAGLMKNKGWPIDRIKQEGLGKDWETFFNKAQKEGVVTRIGRELDLAPEPEKPAIPAPKQEKPSEGPSPVEEYIKSKIEELRKYLFPEKEESYVQQPS